MVRPYLWKLFLQDRAFSLNSSTQAYSSTSFIYVPTCSSAWLYLYPTAWQSHGQTLKRASGHQVIRLQSRHNLGYLVAGPQHKLYYVSGLAPRSITLSNPSSLFCVFLRIILRPALWALPREPSNYLAIDRSFSCQINIRDCPNRPYNHRYAPARSSVWDAFLILICSIILNCEQLEQAEVGQTVYHLLTTISLADHIWYKLQHVTGSSYDDSLYGSPM